MTKALREKITNEELATLKGHVRLVEELVQEDDVNAAQDYLDAITGDAKRVALLLQEAQA